MEPALKLLNQSLNSQTDSQILAIRSRILGFHVGDRVGPISQFPVCTDQILGVLKSSVNIACLSDYLSVLL
jgi:hypothetical protein